MVIYSRENEKVPSSFSFSKRSVVCLEDLPSHLPSAFVCTEDKRFYQHNGFDLIGIARASVQNLKRGRFSQGASTISQQLIKNTHLTLDKTIVRKLKEFKLTRQLERRYSKDEILEIYLNTIYFGHNRYGVSDAAEFYFNKEASELTAAESALLAALVKAPNHYSPFKNPEKSLARRNTVLRLMAEQNALSEKEYKTALNTPLPTANASINARNYSHFAVEEMDKILENLGTTANGKIELFTYLNTNTQAALERACTGLDCDKTCIVIDNTTHGVEGYCSTVPSIKRSPGSLIKPLIVYAPAFEEGILSPASPILDERINFGEYSPKNYGNEYHGYVSVRTAIAKSLNIPAVKALNHLTVAKANLYAQKMGLEIPQNDQTLAVALGGMEYGYPFSTLVDGYATLASDGRYAPSHFIREIKQNGQTIYRREVREHTVFSPETAYLITDTLRSAVKEGTAKRLRALPFEVAAKTGTVGIGDKNTDAYTVAYTSNHTVGVWLGNADNSPVATTGGGLPCEATYRVLEAIYEDDLPDDFDRPIGVQEVALDAYAILHEQRLQLADPIAPIAEVKCELFDSRYAPKEQSDRFSAPKIATPKIELREKKVRIFFESTPPSYYRYRIFKKANGKEEIVYDGAAFKEFIDEALAANTTYQYAVQPYYQQNLGTSVYLPTIFTPKKDAPPIANAPWWDK
ncbi:MAG: transglycosylase domain-containing protein [Clostridia bacterium]|nr:transglycosylase domain-containing protein [Clostridia bacterium]